MMIYGYIQNFQLFPSYIDIFLFLPSKLDPLNPPFKFFPTKHFSHAARFLSLGFGTVTAQSNNGLLCKGHCTAFQLN